MNHSRKKIFFAIFLSIVVFVGGSLSVLAKPPRKALIYGSLLGVADNSAVYNGQVVPVSNNVFGVYSETDLDMCTRIYLYFKTDSEIVSSFHIELRLLSTAFQLGTQNVGFTRLCNIDSAGNTSDFQSVGTNTTISVDGNVISWDYSGAYNGCSAFQIVVVFQNFVLGSTPVYFEMLALSVNNEETVFSPYESNMLSAVQGIEQAINDDSDLPIDTDDIPPAPDTSSINTGTQTATGYINDFFDEFATGGAVGRVLLPISTYLTVADSFNDNSTGHRVITIIFKLGCGLVIVAFIINGIKRRGDFT